MKKIIENLVFQSIFQLSKIIIPIITVPIISNALKPEGVGIYNYTNSITQYMVILASLGITLYGNREIAQNKDDIKNRSQVFIDIMIMKIIISLISLSIYYITIHNSQYYPIFMGQSLLIFAVMFDISWFFMGLEDFKKVSLINLLYQMISLILIIIYIRNSTDLVKYVYIQSITNFLSQISVWIYLRKQIVICRPKIDNVKNHFVNSFTYFIPQIAILLYTNVNKTILGNLSTKDNVAYYTNAQTLNGLVITLITTLDTVLLPKMSYLSKQKEKKKMIKIMEWSLQIQLFVSIPACIGVVAITPELVPWFFGKDFVFLTELIPLMACLIIIVPIGMAISRQYLLPLGDIRGYNISIIFGAIINLLINLLFIKKLGVYSAIISTISAELLVTTIRVIKFKRNENFNLKHIEIIKSIVCSLIMYTIIRFTTNYFSLSSSILTTSIQVILGGSTYILVSLFLNSQVINFIKKAGF